MSKMGSSGIHRSEAIMGDFKLNSSENLIGMNLA
jgi:hypothetical protein